MAAAGADVIHSIQHKAIKELFRLRVGRRRARIQRNLVLVRGKTLINTIGEFFKFKEVYTHEPRETFGSYNADRVVSVSKDILKHVIFSYRYESGRVERRLYDDDFVVGTVEHPPASDFLQGVRSVGDESLRPLQRLLVAEGVKHPENMGMLLSTAVALRYDGIFLTGPCIDPFNFKVLEASQGVAWTLPYMYGTIDDLLAVCKRHRLAPCAAASEGASEGVGLSPPVPIAELPEFDDRRYRGFCIVVGNETRGVTAELLKKCTRIALPMSELIESLNAGVAGGIIMHTLACAWPPPVE